MRIALLAPLWKTVPPEKYGGSELVVANLAEGFTALGHEVTTFACGDSKPAGKVVEVMPKPMYELVDGFDWSGIKGYEFLSFFEMGKRIQEFDILHNHAGLHPIALAPLLPVPMVTTLHSSMPPDFPYLADAFAKYPFVSISDAQRALAPSLNYIATIHHGIYINSFAPRVEGQGNGFVFVGTISPHKGADIAVRTALALGIPLTIAGEVRESDTEFFNTEILPHVDDKKIIFVGEVGHEDKARLLREADALLFPSRWNEAFGLIMVEALACGTPVIGLDNGAVPEVIEQGKTGFIAKDEAAFIEMAQQASDLSRATCRKEAETRFDLSIMVKKYLAIYEVCRKMFGA